MRERIRAKIQELYGDSKTQLLCVNEQIERTKQYIRAMDTVEELNAVIDALYEKGVLS